MSRGAVAELLITAPAPQNIFGSTGSYFATLGERVRSTNNQQICIRRNSNFTIAALKCILLFQNRINAEVLGLLLDLAKERGITEVSRQQDLHHSQDYAEAS